MFLIVSPFTCTRHSFGLISSRIYNIDIVVLLGFSTLLQCSFFLPATLFAFAWTFCQFTMFTLQETSVFLFFLLFFRLTSVVYCTMWEILLWSCVSSLSLSSFLHYICLSHSFPLYLYIFLFLFFSFFLNVCLVPWLFNVKNAKMCLKAPCNARSFILSLSFRCCCNWQKI